MFRKAIASLMLCVVVFPIYAANCQFSSKLSHSYSFFTIAHEDEGLIITKSDCYIFADSANKVVPDSVEADSNYLPRTGSAIQSVVKYSARDSIVYSTDDKVAALYGEAKVNYQDMDLKAGRIVIKLQQNEVYAKGEPDSAGKMVNLPVMKQGSGEYKIVEATFNYKTKKGFMKEFRTTENDGFIKGERVKRDADNNFYIRDAYYTTCPDLDHPHFYIAASKLKVIPGRKVVTGPANMVIEGVKTPLFIPLGFFPLKRGQQSGIIIPTYGNAVGRGFFLRQGGYYFGLGDHVDAKVLGDIYTNLSWQLGAQSNYNYRYRFNGTFNANYALNKQNNPEDPNYSEFKTFEIRWRHTVDPKARPGTSFGADVNLVGNQYLAYNSYNSSQAFNNNVNSGITFGKVFNKGKQNLSANMRASQNLKTRDISMTLPDISFTVASFQPFKSKLKPTAETWYEKISVNYTGLIQNIITTKDTLLFKPRNTADNQKYFDSIMRNGASHRISVQNGFNLFKFYTVSVGADYSESWTLKTTEKTYDTTTKAMHSGSTPGFARAYNYSVRGGLSTRFYGQVNFKKGRLVAIRHVMNPTLDFSYIPDFSSDKYGFYKTVQTDSAGHTLKYSRFESALFGGPGQGKQGNIGFGLDNNIELKWKKGKDTAEKVQKIKIFESIRASGAYNVFADSMKLSLISVSGRTTLVKTISLNGSAVYDPYTNILVTNNGVSQYYRIKEFSFNSGKIATLTTATIGISAGLNPEMFKRKDPTIAERKKKEMERMGYTPLKVLWSLNANYQIAYDYRNKLAVNGKQFVQTLSFTGSLNPTKNWTINFNSGYDFTAKKISQLGVDLKRDLHCWQFTFNWTPLSAYGNKYFMFNISVKSSTLSELKIPKRKDWFDERKI